MVGTRLTPELKDALDQAVQASGRSMAQEIEMRLQRSFDLQDLLADALVLAYGEQLAGIILMMAAVMDRTGRTAAHWAMAKRRYTGTPLEDIDAWMEHSFAYDQAVEGAMAVLMWARPNIEPNAPTRALASETLGITTASGMLRQLESDGEVDRGPHAAKLKSLLGPVLARKRDIYR